MSRSRWPTEAEMRTHVVGVLTGAVAGLTEPAALAVLSADGILGGQRLRQLHTHLAAHPDAVTSGSSDGPRPLLWLAHTLAGAGHAVVLPRCVACGAQPPDLPVVRDGGRICLPCYRQQTKTNCVRCGRRDRACHRRADGLICRTCRDAEPDARGICPQCGRHRPLRRGPDGSQRCDRCTPRPRHTCAGCGAVAPAAAVTAAGPVCRRCYQYPTRRCGGCGRTTAIEVRATADSPDLCAACRPRTVGTCARCARRTYVNRTDRGRGEPLCQSCQPRTARDCGLCGRPGTVQAFWPVGPVCPSCYKRAKVAPAPCGRCGQTNVLVGADPAAGRICAACAGSPADYTCRRCGQGRRPYRHGLCEHCVLTDRVEELLGAPDTVAPQLRPLAGALMNVNRPASLIRWLDKSHTAQMLTDLVNHVEPITHQRLDQLLQHPYLHQLRHILTRSGVLPDRDEYLARIQPWLRTLLDDAPAGHADLVGRFANWALDQPNLRRRRSPGPTLTPGGGYHRRSDIRSILRFLDWLDHTGHTLATLTQADLDTWLADGPGTRTRIRRFLIWAYREGIAPALTVTQPRTRAPAQPMPGDIALHHLDRCLHDDQIPLDIRVAGALTLLYGLSLAQLSHLTPGHLSHHDDDVHLTVGRAPIVLPPHLATLIVRLARQRRDPSPISRAVGDTTWLFPGGAAGRPARPSTLGNRLQRNGIAAGPGRITALNALTAELSLATVSDLLGGNPRHLRASRAGSRGERSLTRRARTPRIGRRSGSDR